MEDAGGVGGGWAVVVGHRFSGCPVAFGAVGRVERMAWGLSRGEIGKLGGNAIGPLWELAEGIWAGWEVTKLVSSLRFLGGELVSGAVRSP